LLFLSLVFPAGALEVPREILIEVAQPPALQPTAAGTRTGLPDLDALLDQYPGSETRYALPAAGDRHPALRPYLLIRLDRTRAHETAALRQRLARLASVRWAAANALFRPHYVPDDSLYAQQWGLTRVGAAAAWNTTRGSATAPLAIIDTGCDMDHSDLAANLWVNPGEDLDGSGAIEAGEINGLDDDNNGYIDDFYGWDFVDAPTFPSSGDYLVRDNDPSDEMGHGTAMAGICGAVQDNGSGVTGLAPGCPLMILRAGNANGYLQEDDVASAILYALENGARVVNMSFGDTQASPMLDDVINYAAQNGLLLVAASGNYGNTTVIYPAAFGPVLCVGACNPGSQRTSTSSYGTSLDLLAPGLDILTTALGDGYQEVSGTSCAAAFVSAAAGLVLSQHPDWDPVEVSSVLQSAADDVYTPGWDPQSGQGVLRADRALEVQEALVAQITGPAMSQGFAQADTLNITGTAAGVYLKQYLVLAGVGDNPTAAQWDTVKYAVNTQVVDGLLGVWTNPEPLDTAYTIRLEAVDLFGNVVDDRVVVYYDPTPPVISDLLAVPIFDGDRPSYLMTFTTDDVTGGQVWLRSTTGAPGRWISQSLSYETTDHVVVLGGNLNPSQYLYYLAVTNRSGLTTLTDTLGPIDLRQASIATNNLVEQPLSGIPPGYLYEEATDLDGDGFLEIWQDSLGAGGAKSALQVWEATTAWTFSRQNLDYGVQIPKSIGDSDADGLPELLTLYAGVSRIYEAETPGGFPQPDNVVWEDSAWGARLLDLDSLDGHGEVLLVIGGVYHLYANNGSGALSFIQDLPNPFDPNPGYLPPYCRVGDFDGDGFTELLFGDYDGNLYIYERKTDGSLSLTWSASLPQLDTGEFLADGDFDGDGEREFAALAHTPTMLAGEHLANTRYWTLYLFKAAGDDDFLPVDTLYFFGAENPADFASGLSAGDVYGGPADELLVCVYPDFYMVAWDAVAGEYAISWYYPQCRSNKAVVGDFNGNGHNEVLFNTGTATKIFEAEGSWSHWPPPPLNFQTEGLADRVNLSWSPVSGAHSYILYRGPHPDSLDLLATLQGQGNVDTTDFNVILDQTYYYAISTFKLGSTAPEGPTTVPQAATPNLPPYVPGDTAHFVPPNFVIVDFSEPMGNSILDPNNYLIMPELTQPQSAVSDAGGTRAVLTFERLFTDDTYRLIIHELFDMQGSALSTLNDTLSFTVSAAASTPPYLTTAFPSPDGHSVTLVFSQAMAQSDLANKLNYTITTDAASNLTDPDPVYLDSARSDAGQPNVAHLYVNPRSPIGATGKVYRVEARNLHNQQGVPIDTTHNAADLYFTAPDLDNLYVYPNPYVGGTLVDGEPCVVFANLTANAEVRIMTLAGHVIRHLKTSGLSGGGLRWYLDNERGESVGSGIYLFYVTGDGDTYKGKLAVVR